MRITAALPLIVAGVMLASCGSPQDRAGDQAYERAAEVRHHLDPRSRQVIAAESLARHAIEHGWQVVKLEGRDTGQGVGLTLLIVSEVPNRVIWPSRSETFTFCYELRFTVEGVTFPKQVPCPGTAPITVGPPPPDPRLPSPEELKALLEKATADEAAVRERLAGLGLDQSIRVQVHAGNGYVGAAMRWDDPDGGYDCVLGRIGPSGAEAWAPARAYLRPGELSCSGADASLGHGQRPPH